MPDLTLHCISECILVQGKPLHQSWQWEPAPDHVLREIPHDGLYIGRMYRRNQHSGQFWWLSEDRVRDLMAELPVPHPRDSDFFYTLTKMCPSSRRAMALGSTSYRFTSDSFWGAFQVRCMLSQGLLSYCKAIIAGRCLVLAAAAAAACL